ncbi:response regulator transcription factor [Streptomyces lincolnensis]|uniref:response regulator transcription factor n=1 Tax=Streptomyces lincolnensis TaxID=1915 RepID=UPI001E2B60E7|nr:response regulator transcription factor [Streptomyces lincolnensis]
MTYDSCVPDHPYVLVGQEAIEASETLVMALRFLGFDAHVAATGADLLREVSRRRPDAVLLDTTLPDGCGVEVCRRLRAAGVDAPVMFLSSRSDIEGKCQALAMGGDDYVTRPADLTEVSARIRALVRRSRAGGPAPSPAAHKLRAAGVELDENTRDVSLHGRAVRLSATEFALLRLLMRNAGRVISKGEILDSVWNYGFQGESGVVETYVYYLRRKLGDSRQSVIRTVRGAGYMVCAGDPAHTHGTVA